MIERIDVLGVGLSAINMTMALDEITHWIETRESHYKCVTGIAGAREDGPGGEVGFRHPERLLDPPEVVVVGDDLGGGHERGVDVQPVMT